MKNKTIKTLFWVGQGGLILCGLVMAWFWRSLPPQVPWFYSLPSGEMQLVNKSVMALTLGGGMLSVFITRVIALWAGKEDDSVAITIMVGGLVVVGLLMAGFGRVLQIMTGI